MLSDILPPLDSYPSVKHFLDAHLDMQFEDVRAMLRLPLPECGIPAGCNFAAAAALCNLISGLSVSLFKPPGAAASGEHRPGTGQLFKKLLTEYFPWERDEDATGKKL